jgi:DNA-nicking Smr family endonuclease
VARAVREANDDGELFEAAVSGAAPLADRERVVRAPEAGRRPATASPKTAFHLAEDGATGRAADVSRKLLRELAAGQHAPRATLDLHRHTMEVALARLTSFLHQARTDNHRCVLVITGRAERSPSGARLRDHVPGWLSGPLGGSVLAFAPARAEHGGRGALYVLLRNR